MNFTLTKEKNKDLLEQLGGAALKGDTGAQGIQGVKGDTGLTGANGDTIIDQRTQLALKMWTGTQAEYDAVTTKDENTLYLVKEATL